MIRFLQNLTSVNVDATKKAKVDIKRGMFVKVDEVKGEVDIAATIDEATGIAVRDVVVDEDVANGLPVSDYSETQDTIKVGEFCGERKQFSGERFMTDQFVNTLVDGDVTPGKNLTVTNGKLDKIGTVTTIISLGFRQDAGHKVLAYKIV